MPNNDSLRLKRAKQIVMSELRLYDALSRKAKVIFERPESRYALEARQVGPEVGYQCGHRVSLTLPCEKCQRSVDDCREYITALQSKLKELLNGIKTTKV